MKNLLSILALLLLTQLSHAKELPTTPTTKWPGKYTKIVAVTYNYGADTHGTVVIKDRLHKGIYRTSKPLTKQQTQTLLSAFNKKHPPAGGFLCYLPHHGFILYGEDDKIVGHISVCLLCNDFRATPAKGLPRHWHVPTIKKLLQELEMPIHKHPGDYTKEYQATKKQ